MDFRLFGKGYIILPRLMSHSSRFSKLLADVFALWHCVNSHQKAPDQQTVNTWAFIEVLTLADDLLLTLLIYMAMTLYLKQNFCFYFIIEKFGGMTA